MALYRQIWKSSQRGALARYVQFERLRATGLKFTEAVKEARISGVTVRRWRKMIGMTTRGRGGKHVKNELPFPIRNSRFRKAA
jgi:hypothetical protein